jgi:dihydroorotase
VCEFEYAGTGAMGLETAFGAFWSLLNTDISLEKWVEMASLKPRKLFHLEGAEIKEQHPANLTLFNPDEEYVFKENMIRSHSRNNPYIGKSLKGRVKGTVLHAHLTLCD